MNDMLDFYLRLGGGMGMAMDVAKVASFIEIYSHGRVTCHVRLKAPITRRTNMEDRFVSHRAAQTAMPNHEVLVHARH